MSSIINLQLVQCCEKYGYAWIRIREIRHICDIDTDKNWYMATPYGVFFTTLSWSPKNNLVAQKNNFANSFRFHIQSNFSRT